MKPHIACFALSWPLACGEAPDCDCDLPDAPHASEGDASGSADSGASDDEPPPVDLAEEGELQPAEPTPETDEFMSRVHSVVIQTDGSRTAIGVLAIDGEGTMIGVLSTFVDQDRAPNLEANFFDGDLDVVVIQGEPKVEGTLPPEVLAARAMAMLHQLPPADTPESRGPFTCAAMISLAVSICAPLAAGEWKDAATCSAGVITSLCGCAAVVELDEGGICSAP